MAKYHMTPDGPKKCSAQTEESCHYTHYSTPEGAIAAAEIEKSKKSAVEAKAALENRLNNLSDDEAVQPVHDFSTRGDLGPSIVERMDEIEARTGKRPQFVPGIASGIFKGPGGEYHFTASKGYAVEGNPPRVIPHWTLTTQQVLNGRTINRERESYPLTNAVEGRTLKKAAFSKLTQQTERAWPAEASTAQTKRDESVDSFVNVVNSCETAERGVLEADRIGFSNFRESTDDKVVVKADWAESVVHPQNMIDAMNSDRYKRTNPDVHVLIQDSQCKRSPNYWTAERDAQGWRVHLTRGNDTEVREVDDMDTMKSTIYDFSRNEMHSSEERASRSAQDTSDFFGVTEFQVQKQEERVAEQKHQDQLEREKDLHEDLYGEKPKLRKGGLGKLFSAFV